MGAASSVASSNPVSANGSEVDDYEASVAFDDCGTSTDPHEKEFVQKSTEAEAEDSGTLLPVLETCIAYDKQKLYLGDDGIPYSRQVQYAYQCPKGHPLVPVGVLPSRISKQKRAASPTSLQGSLATKEPLLVTATQIATPKSEFEWDPLQLIATRKSEAKKSTIENDLLRTACANGDLDLVTRLLDQGADVNHQSKIGISPLHACVFSSNMKVAQLLLSRGADQMQGDESEMAPIHYAAAEGATALVQLFVECAGTNIAGLIGAEGITPAHMAASIGHSNVLSYISEACGPEFCDQLDSQGNSPLHLASSRGHTDCVNVLLQMGCRSNLRNADQMTPLMAALKAENVHTTLAAVRLLLPFTEVIENDEVLIPQELMNNLNCAESAFEEYSTGAVKIEQTANIHTAVICDSISELRVLLFAGARVDMYDAQGFTPFHYACSKSRLDMVALMLNFGNHKELETSLLRPGTGSPLMCAISANCFPIVQYLVYKFPLWLEVRDSEGVLPVAAAIEHCCSLELVRALVIGGADLKAIAKSVQSASGTDALPATSQNVSVHEFANNFDTEAANFVRIANVDRATTQPHWCATMAKHVGIWSGTKCPLIHQAAFLGKLSQLRELLRVRGAKCEERDKSGFTALHAACSGGSLAAVDVLLKANFIVDASDNKAGLSPLFFAVNGGFPIIVERLMPLVLDASTLYDAQGRSLLLLLPDDETAAITISTTILSIFPFVDDTVENQNVASHIEHVRSDVQSAASHIVNTDPVSFSHVLNQLPLLIHCRMNSEGHTLLHMACERLEATICVDLLCSVGAPVEAVMSNGLSALHVAALYKNLAAMKILLSYGASADLPDINGLTPLHIAVLESHAEGIDLFVNDWHAESTVPDFKFNSQDDASCSTGEVTALGPAVAIPDDCSGHVDEATDTCFKLICHVCLTSTSHSDSIGWFECSFANCCDFYALCKSCMHILKAQESPPASPFLKLLGKPELENSSQSPTMPIVDSSKTGLSFDKKGVRLDFLRAFKTQHFDACRHMTTEQICHLVIKPQTALHRSSFVSQLSKTEQNHYFGQNCNWFVSHAWQNLFFPMIDAVLTFFDQRVDANAAIIWIDVFCISQHTNPESLVSPLWLIAYSKCIQQAGRMLWVIESWSNPKPLCRSWCLMEALTILREIARRRAGLFKIIILDEAYQEMHRIARDNPQEFCSAVSELIGGIDLESSECSFENEKIGILKQLEKLGTFEMLNFNMSGIIENWVFDMLRQMTLDMIEAGDEEALFDFRLSLAVVFTEMGRLHQALEQRELRLVVKYKLLDQHSEADSAEVVAHTVSLADALLDVAESYALLNRFEDSLKFQQEAQKYYLRVLHQDDLQHAKIMAQMAGTHYNLEQGDTALKLLDCALQFHRRVLPQHDPSVFCAEAAVASMHRDMQDFTIAFDLEKQVLEKRLQHLPLNHPDIGSSHFNIALTLPFVESLSLQERNSSILQSLNSALAVWKQSVKPSDPRLLIAKQKLALFEDFLQQEAPNSHYEAAC